LSSIEACNVVERDERLITTLPLRLLKEELELKEGMLLTLSDVTNANDDKRMVDTNNMITICSFLVLQS
jgi:hypothetical protein